jgi:hypothetical protein
LFTGITVAIVLILSSALTGVKTEPVKAAGHSYYVDFTTGSDSNPGTEVQPLKYHPWMSDATSGITLQPGDTIYMKRGETWSKSGATAPWISVQASGSAGSPITTTAYGTGNLPLVKIATGANRPVISDTGGHAYITWDSLDIQHYSSTWLLSTTYADGIEFEKSGANVPHDWIITNCEIHNIPETAILNDTDCYNITIGDVAATATATASAYSNNIHDYGYGGIILRGANPTTLRSDWNVYYNYVHTGTGGNPANHNCYGIAFGSSGNSTGWPKYVTVRYNRVEDIPMWEGIDTHGGQYIYFLDNYVKNCYRAILLSMTTGAGYPMAIGDHEYAERNIIENPASISSGDAFIDVSSGSAARMTNIFVVNNILFYTTTPSTPPMQGILLENVDGLTVTGNTLTNGSTSLGINIEGFGKTVTDANIQNNYIQGWSPGISVYASAVAGAVQVERNVVFTIKPLSIYADAAMPAAGVLTVQHNTLVADSSADTGVIIWTGGASVAGSSVSFLDNIIANSSGGAGPPYAYIDLRWTTFSGTFASDYNLYWGISSTLQRFRLAAGDQTWAQWQALGYDTHSVGPNIDPLFVNASGNYSLDTDFKLQSTSPAIDKGASIPGYTTDYSGETITGIPDIGAWEYRLVASAPSAPTPTATPTPSPTPTPTPTPSSATSSSKNATTTSNSSSATQLAISVTSIFDNIRDKDLQISGSSKLALETQYPTFRGTTIPEGIVDIYIYSSDVIHGVTTANTAGAWEYKVTQPLSNGDHTVYATVTDPNGKVSTPSDKISFNVNATSPAASTTNTKNYTWWWVFGALGLIVLIAGALVLRNRKKERPQYLRN